MVFNYFRGRGVLFVMPAKAGIQVTLYQIFWIPAFAGMTDWIAENSPHAQLFESFDLVHHKAAIYAELKYFMLAFLCDLCDSSEAGGESLSKH